MNIQLTVPLPKPFLKDNNKLNRDFQVCSSYLTSETLWRESEMGLGLSTGGKEGGKHPKKTPGGSVSTALCVPALRPGNDSPPSACGGLSASPGRGPASAPRGEAAAQTGGGRG